MRAKGSSSITISPTHASSSFFTTGQSRSPCRIAGPRLLNYESPPSFTFIYRCTIPLDLLPRFSRLLFLFFVPPPLNLLFPAARFHFVFYRRAFVPFRKPIDKIHIVTLHRIKLRLAKSIFTT